MNFYYRQRLIEQTWRNVNLSLRLVEDPPLPPSTGENTKSPIYPQKELKRFGSDLSTVMHEASIRSSQSYRLRFSPKTVPTSPNVPISPSLSRLQIPEEILALRNRKKCEKFVFRLSKGTNWTSQFLNSFFWGSRAATMFETEGATDDIVTTKVSKDQSKSHNLVNDTKSSLSPGVPSRPGSSSVYGSNSCWSPGRSAFGTVGQFTDHDEESEVFTAVKSDLDEDDEDDDDDQRAEWSHSLFDNYCDSDDRTRDASTLTAERLQRQLPDNTPITKSYGIYTVQISP